MPSDKTTATEELQVTTPDQWKGVAKEGTIITLPSGNNVRVRRTMDLLHLLKAGKIPNPLAGIVQNMMNKGVASTPSLDEIGGQGIMDMMRLVDATVIKSVTEPKVEAEPEPEADETAEEYQARIEEWTPSPGALPLSFFDIDDRMFVFVYAQGFAADLASFREEQEAAMASLSHGEGVQPAAKRPRRGN